MKSNRRGFLKGAMGACAGGVAMLCGDIPATATPKIRKVVPMRYDTDSGMLTPIGPATTKVEVSKLDPSKLPSLRSLQVQELADAISVPMRCSHQNKNKEYWSPFETWIFTKDMTHGSLRIETISESQYVFILDLPDIDGEIIVPPIEYHNTVDWSLKYARDERWDIVGRAMQCLDASLQRGPWLHQWHTILAAGCDRNMVVYDSVEEGGKFTPRLVSLCKTIMRRNSGFPATSPKYGKTTDIAIGDEAFWDAFGKEGYITKQCGGNDLLRREYYFDDNNHARLYGVDIHSVPGLDPGEELYDFYDDNLRGTLPKDKRNLMVGMDASKLDNSVI